MVVSSESIPDSIETERVIDEYTTGREGVTVVVTGGLHGNEPAGVLALRRVFKTLQDKVLPMRGRLIGVAGNIGALAQGKRYLGRDLNRKWYPDFIQALFVNLEDSTIPEDHEQRELARFFQELSERSSDPFIILDVHSTSAKGAAFTGIADTLRNRKIGFSLQAPVVLGLEETIDGSMLGYLADMGHTTIMFEGGQHQEPDTVDNAEAAIWQTLKVAGLLLESEIPDYPTHWERLKKLREGLPKVVEIRYRHVVSEGDGFQMNPGYTNFQRVVVDEHLAKDYTGKLFSSETGRILMPLYQPMGEDGYFIIRDIPYFWLRVSAVLRRLRLDKLIPMLPGVRPHPEKEEHYIADSKIARFFVREIFHLFGFRRRMQLETGDYVFSRRRPHV